MNIHENFSVLNGTLSAGPRSSVNPNHLVALNITAIVTLQLDTENISEVSETCTALSLLWLWLPIRAVNWELIKNPEIFPNVLEGVKKIKQLLQEGKNIFIHCHAGIHRTGFILYAVLRICGLTESETLEGILKIRPVTLERVGKLRLEIAEEFFQASIGNTVIVPYYEVLEIRQGDFLNPKLPILLFLKVFFCGNVAAVQFLATTSTFYKVSIGGEMLVKCEEEFLWKERRVCGEKEGKVRGLESCDLVLEEFLTSITENETKILVGSDCFFDKEFLIRCCPRVNRILHYRIIDIQSVRMGKGRRNENVYDDVREMMGMRSKILQAG